MLVDVTYEDGSSVAFILADNISMIDACKTFANVGRVVKVEFPPLDTPEDGAVYFGPLVRVVPAGAQWDVHVKIEGTWEWSAWCSLRNDAVRIAQDLRRKLLEGERI